MLEDDLQLEVNWQPFELDPTTPPEGVSVLESMGIDHEQYEASYRYIKQRTDELGLAFNPTQLKFNTRKAHLLAEYARERGNFDALRRELFAAYFARGENLADDRVLTEILKKVGLDPQSALQAIRDGAYDETLRLAAWQAQSLGVRGVPAFIVENKYLISGAQPYERMLEALRSIKAQSASSDETK